MASIWIRNDSGEVVETPLRGWVAVLRAGHGVARGGRRRGVMLVRTGSDPNAPWALIAGPTLHASINGERVLTGIRVLDSRDEIRCGPLAAVFSDEHLARVEPFPDAGQPVRCARCTCDIAPASPAVRCPACSSWYHQQEHGDFPCWTAVPFCQACGCATRIDTDGWKPQEF